jgi:hypothetical protein
MMRRTLVVLAAMTTGIAASPACENSPEASLDAGPGPLDCAALDAQACSTTELCTWTQGKCVAIDVDSGTDGSGSDAVDETDAPLCGPNACPPPLCGFAHVGGQEVCILKPDCTGLPEPQCAATVGCRVILGRHPWDPPETLAYVGCGDGTGNPGTMIRCTASGAEAECWIVPDTAVPSGWTSWPCAHPETQAECMAPGPYGADAGPADSGGG